MKKLRQLLKKARETIAKTTGLVQSDQASAIIIKHSEQVLKTLKDFNSQLDPFVPDMRTRDEIIIEHYQNTLRILREVNSKTKISSLQDNEMIIL